MQAPRLRRMGIVLVAVLTAIDLTAAGGVLWLHGRDRAEPVSTDQVVARFRDGGPVLGSGDDAAPTPAADQPSDPDEQGEPDGQAPASPTTSERNGGPGVESPTPESGAAAATDPGPVLRRPAEGVYVYDTVGHEEVDALGGARHDYPEQTTIVVRHTECGTTEEWQPLEERVDVRQVCTDGSTIRLDWYDSFHSFFGATDHRRLECEDASAWLGATTAPGDTFAFSCTDPETDARNRAEYLARETVVIGGTRVEALHVRFTSTVTGKSRATTTQEVWLDPRTGLTLLKRAVLDGTSPGPSGDVAYHEEYELELTSLEPLR